MDSEFPDEDEEFDLLHQDEYELLKETEEPEKKIGSGSEEIKTLQEKPKKKDESGTFIPNVHKELHRPISNVHKELNTIRSTIFNKLCMPSTSKDNQCTDNHHTDVTKKRNYDELFGDISDIYDINNFDSEEPREKRPRWDQHEDVIKAVLDAREKFHDHSRGVSGQKKGPEIKRDSISLRVPRWNFIAVTRLHDAQRIYVRVRNSEQTERKAIVRVTSNLLSVPYSQLKAEAEEIIVQNVKRASLETSKRCTTKDKEDHLWVDKYKPRSYIELLSDENVNRHLLHWIKLWDKVVFNRNYVQSRKKKVHSTFKNINFMNENTVEEVDNKGIPIQRIVLLTGPPGLGKTTLAHLAANHAGYNVVEINASDERSPAAFRQILLSSTQMKAVMGNDPRPNCLVFDEIDGAPAASIELLLKFVQGKLVPKGKREKAKGDKQANVCHRPVICICNEPYTPSLRSLRIAALIIPVPEVSPARLADRLMEISRMENLKVNPDALLRLAEISGCDIRSCLGALQYMGGIKFGDNVSFALKDSRKGLFDSWKEILTIPMNKNGILPIPERVRLVLKTVQNGESEKLMQGIFHNYPEIGNDKMNHIAICLQWFQFFDEILSLVAQFQVWSVMRYINHAFITWHLYFAKTRSVKLSYPSVTYEMHQKGAKTAGILTTIQRSSGRDRAILTVDIAPFLPNLLTPRLRTVSGHLHSAKEREDISRLVNILLDFGLVYTQEKSIDGIYDYKLDPDIFEIGIFPNCKHRRTLVYAVKQIIVQELEAERLRRAANMIKGKPTSTQNKDAIEPEANAEAQNNKSLAANMIKGKPTSTQNKDTIEPKANAEAQNNMSKAPTALELSKRYAMGPKQAVYKDFFGRIISINQDKQQSNKECSNSRNILRKNGVWYKYKEGFSNAVRRTVRMKDIL